MDRIYTEFIQAVNEDKVELVKLLLKNNLSKNNYDNFVWSFVFSKEFNIEYGKLLFSYHDIYGSKYTWLQWVSHSFFYGNKDRLLKLINIGVSLDSKRNELELLRYIAAIGDIELMSSLKEHGVDIYQQDNYALKVAKRNKHRDLIDFLQQ